MPSRKYGNKGNKHITKRKSTAPPPLTHTPSTYVGPALDGAGIESRVEVEGQALHVGFAGSLAWVGEEGCVCIL